ncbi:hypothetical protein LJR267_009325 [Paraburkholderia hospita]
MDRAKVLNAYLGMGTATPTHASLDWHAIAQRTRWMQRKCLVRAASARATPDEGAAR